MDTKLVSTSVSLFFLLFILLALLTSNDFQSPFLCSRQKTLACIPLNFKAVIVVGHPSSYVQWVLQPAVDFVALFLLVYCHPQSEKNPLVLLILGRTGTSWNRRCMALRFCEGQVAVHWTTAVITVIPSPWKLDDFPVPKDDNEKRGKQKKKLRKDFWVQYLCRTWGTNLKTPNYIWKCWNRPKYTKFVYFVSALFLVPLNIEEVSEWKGWQLLTGTYLT